MSESDTSELTKIWQGDLFDRRSEAKLLAAFVESVWQRPLVREDKRSYTIAVDTGYGEGKSFFLKRLAKTLALNHPVAFVDAWTDDIADEPLTALAATLKKALEPYIAQNSEVSSRWSKVVDKTGKVAWIVGKGLLRRGVSLAITGGGLEAVDAVLDTSSEAIQDAAEEAVKDLGKELPGELSKATKLASPSSLMSNRISDFEEGAAAITELKESLVALVSSIEEMGAFPPIVIIIDELDRCRPTYSVKLMEEIKHLFDVPGLVFIFGMHGDQLANSMAAAYGNKFDGASYLRRFINRRYTLKTPSLSPLVSLLMKQSGITNAQIHGLYVQEKNEKTEWEPAEVISRYMRLYNLTARDAFGVLDILQTCSALSAGGQLLSAYILPLAISQYLGATSGQIIETEAVSSWQVVIPSPSYEGQDQVKHPIEWAKELHRVAAYSNRDIMRLANENDPAGQLLISVISNGRANASPFLHPSKYSELLRSVGRFTNPELSGA